MANTDQQSIGELPDLGPDAYAEWRSSDIGAITEHLERRLILDLLGDVRGRRVLDVGCGDGELAVELAKRGAHVAGIDAAPSMIDAAQQRAASAEADVDFRIAPAQEIPFPREQFDIVVAITVLCFVDDGTPVFREMARVLQPGGHLVIGELGKWSTWAASRRVRGWLGSELWKRGRFRRPGDLRSLAKRADLKVETVRGAVYFPRWTPAARFMARYDQALSRITNVGAAFLALRATKPRHS